MIPGTNRIPEGLVPFDQALSKSSFNHFVHFYMDDERFERIWKRSVAYLDRLSKFQGVIPPDFSLYRDLPLGMQVWNTYHGHVLGYWLSRQGLEVISNVRWGDERATPSALTAYSRVNR